MRTARLLLELHLMRKGWLVLAMVLSAATAQAKPARDVISTLERGVRLMANARVPVQEISVAASARGAVWLRPDVRAIGISTGLSRRAFFLGAEGRLPEVDRNELRAALSRLPGLTPAGVVRGVRADLARARAERRRLSAAQPIVRQLLATAGGASERVLWRGRGASITFRPTVEGGMLVLDRAFRSEGVWLTAGPGGLSLDDRSLREVQGFILAHGER